MSFTCTMQLSKRVVLVRKMSRVLREPSKTRDGTLKLSTNKSRAQKLEFSPSKGGLFPSIPSAFSSSWVVEMTL